MSVEREAVISNESGIHARVAAMIVQRARELSEKYHTKLYLRGTRGERFLMRSIMKLIALKTRRGDAVFVTAPDFMGDLGGGGFIAASLPPL